MERRFKRAVRTIEKADKLGLNNLLVLRSSFESIVSDVPAKRLAGIFVLFPDPWPKPKNTKNRILSASNLELFSHMLEAGASITIRTDHQEYFGWILEQAKLVSTLQIVQSTRDLYRDFPDQISIQTEFEHLFLSQGKPVAMLVLQNN